MSYDYLIRRMRSRTTAGEPGKSACGRWGAAAARKVVKDDGRVVIELRLRKAMEDGSGKSVSDLGLECYGTGRLSAKCLAAKTFIVCLAAQPR
jgi:hypothetical protein